MFNLFQVARPKERLRETLPKPPAGMAWLQNPKTREWKLVPEEEVLPERVEDPSELTVDFETTAHNSQRSAFEHCFAEENYHDIPTPPRAGRSASPVCNPQRVVVTLPEFGNGESKSDEADWEMLSDRGSTHSHGIAFVSRTGSVSTRGSSLLHRRNPSSSTIDSTDLMNLGPSGKGVLGVDYVEHVILPTDTLQGICLAYKIAASRLKRANHFSGESLLLAPKKLVIPISKQALRQGYLRVQDTDSKEYKLHAIQVELPMLGLTEAKAYLELADWVLKDAIQSAREDNEWEKEVPKGKLQPGEIRVMMNVQPDAQVGHVFNFSAQGAGYPPIRNTEEEKTNECNATSTCPVHPKLANPKSIKVEDIDNVSPTHNSFGVEMQSLSISREATAGKEKSWW